MTEPDNTIKPSTRDALRKMSKAGAVIMSPRMRAHLADLRKHMRIKYAKVDDGDPVWLNGPFQGGPLPAHIICKPDVMKRCVVRVIEDGQEDVYGQVLYYKEDQDEVPGLCAYCYPREEVPNNKSVTA